MLKFAKWLKKLGREPLLAEGQAEALSEVFEANLNEVATKKDLKHLEDQFDIKLSELKFEMLKWVIGLALAQFALLVGILIKLLLLSH